MLDNDEQVRLAGIERRAGRAGTGAGPGVAGMGEPRGRAGGSAARGRRRLLLVAGSLAVVTASWLVVLTVVAAVAVGARLLP